MPAALLSAGSAWASEKEAESEEGTVLAASASWSQRHMSEARVPWVAANSRTNSPPGPRRRMDSGRARLPVLMAFAAFEGARKRMVRMARAAAEVEGRDQACVVACALPLSLFFAEKRLAIAMETLRD